MKLPTGSLGCLVAFILALAAPPALAGAGCLCDVDLYPKVLLGKATAQDLSRCEEGRPSREDALSCMRALSYKNVKQGDQTAESFRLGVDALVAASKDKALSKGAANLLLSSQSYRDSTVRAKVRPVMVAAGRAPLWDTLVSASDGDAAAFTRALYAYCEHYNVISELALEDVTLDQLWPPPAGVKPADARKRLACPYGQNLLMAAAIRSLQGKVPADALALLSPAQLRLLRNAVYARHGRVFQAKDLQDFFSREPWYQPDPAYTDARLTAEDQQHLTLIQAAEAKAAKGGRKG
ncbi:YARHG domain-containing protein [Myxococcus sp. RHSTA-1-4]|uniref:YARHG domain-containing protein n=1 Tax=Myxococcus sp. RHSTA-1-4 TaxID=2874601 RepID=UPI001CBB892D|nr:YARHG domain-containing protein [Myxococcus sp. RHSTA-1-4]MBZ4418806.1 YARHG domain-containing protein [Myxococcus sp. RHSTA-1-4]